MTGLELLTDPIPGIGCSEAHQTAHPCPDSFDHGMATELPPDVSIGRIAEFGALIGDPARIAMLIALLNEDWLSATTLAMRAGITPQTASGHLTKLVAGGLVKVQAAGRHRLHIIASSEARDIVRHIYAAGNLIKRPSRPATGMLRLARMCSGHLAGRLATELAGCLADLDDREQPRLRGSAIPSLQFFGLDGSVRREIRLCRDWTECCPHLGGSLGRSILQRSLQLGWLRQNSGSSALSLTPGGIEGFRNRFGISLSAAA